MNNEVDATVRIPFTPNSNLKELFHKWDDNYIQTLNIPRIQFIGNVGTN